MRIKTLLWLIYAICFLFSASSARADCAGAVAFHVPAPGSALPPNPTIYAFVPYDYPTPDVVVKSGDQKIAATVEQVSTNDSFKSYRIKITKADAGTIEVLTSLTEAVSLSVWAKADYSIVPTWKKATEAKEVQTTMLGQESYGWECSHHLTWNLEPSVPAMAYEAVWASSHEDFAAGKHISAVFPMNLDGFFNPKLENMVPAIKIGHPNCLFNNFEWSSPIAYMGLVALHPDGSKTPAAKTPAEVPWRFDSAIFGPMTDEFYQEVHGTDKQGNPVEKTD
ncbi:MAG: hypothetical protein HN348_17460 [Proteobacteria bacterium]|nr:hypothetical protein [Pseudomonadota bacterium]